MLSQLTVAFNFRLIGVQQLRGRDVYVLDATRRPGYRPVNSKAKVLTGMRGKLWIDTQTYHWVRVEAVVVDPVYFEGFFARVDPGTRFILDKAPAGPDVWLPTHFAMHVNSKILGVFGHNSSEEDTYSHYRRGSPAASASRGR